MGMSRQTHQNVREVEENKDEHKGKHEGKHRGHKMKHRNAGQARLFGIELQRQCQHLPLLANRPVHASNGAPRSIKSTSAATYIVLRAMGAAE